MRAVETLAMKGLFLNHLDQKTQAYDFVKLGLRHDLMSPICTHFIKMRDFHFAHPDKCRLARLWPALPVRQELRGGHEVLSLRIEIRQGILLCI